MQDGYYIPFYFQAAQGVSAAQSGIRFIPLAFPEVVAILLTAVVINKTGHYVNLKTYGFSGLKKADKTCIGPIDDSWLCHWYPRYCSPHHH